MWRGPGDLQRYSDDPAHILDELSNKDAGHPQLSSNSLNHPTEAQGLSAKTIGKDRHHV